MVRSLQPPETRRWSDIASVLIPALGAIGIVLVGYVTVRVLDIATNPSSITPAESARLFSLMVGGVFLPPGLALIGYIMFLWIYSKTKDRLSKGLMQLYASVPPPMVWVPPVPPPPVAPNPGFAPPVAGTTIACPKCGFASPPMNAFCMNCGASLKS